MSFIHLFAFMIASIRYYCVCMTDFTIIIPVICFVCICLLILTLGVCSERENLLELPSYESYWTFQFSKMRSGLVILLTVILALSMLHNSAEAADKKKKKKNKKTKTDDKNLFDSHTLRCLVCQNVVDEFLALVHKYATFTTGMKI